MVTYSRNEEMLAVLRLLVARGWGKGAIARRLGVTPGAVTRWLSEDRMPAMVGLVTDALNRLLQEPASKGLPGRPRLHPKRVPDDPRGRSLSTTNTNAV